MYKLCSKCNIHKSLNDFHKLKKGRFGKHSICKICRKTARINKIKLQKNQLVITKNILCNKCNIIKSPKLFYKNYSSKNGYQNYCKECQRELIAKSMSKIENYSKILIKK